MTSPHPAPRSFVEQARRAQIVGATIETLAEVGFARTSFTRIAERAGVSPALISYHFDGKEELLTEVIRVIEQAMDESISAATGDVQSYVEALNGLLTSFAAYVAEHPAEMLALGEIYRNAPPDGAANEHAASTRASTIKELEDMFVDAQEAGEFRRFEPRPMAVVLYAALESIPTMARAGTELDAVAYGRELAELFDRGTRA